MKKIKIYIVFRLIYGKIISTETLHIFRMI